MTADGLGAARWLRDEPTQLGRAGARQECNWPDEPPCRRRGNPSTGLPPHWSGSSFSQKKKTTMAFITPSNHVHVSQRKLRRLAKRALRIAEAHRGEDPAIDAIVVSLIQRVKEF